jgi:hypothetical protein
MASGLPVIASPNGGMRELVEDGVSGWIASAATPAAFAATLRRALDTSAPDRERMGHAAAEAVDRVCNNGSIVRRRLEHTRRLLESRGAVASVTGSVTGRIGVVVSAAADSAELARCLESIQAQRADTRDVIVVCDNESDMAARIPDGYRVVRRAAGDRESELIAAEQLLRDDVRTLGIAWVDATVQLDPGCLSRCADAFDRLAAADVISGWARESGPVDRIYIQPVPTQPHVWVDGALAPFVVARAAAAANQLAHANSTRSRRALLNALVAGSGKGMTYPAVLASASSHQRWQTAPASRQSRMAGSIQRLHTPVLQWLWSRRPAERWAFLLDALERAARRFLMRAASRARDVEHLLRRVRAEGN